MFWGVVAGRNVIVRRGLLAGPAVAVFVAAVTGGIPPGVAQGFAYLLPALVLLLALAARLYPGERTLLRLMGRRNAARPGGTPPGVECRPTPRVMMPRGGRLIASYLAGRPPPVLVGVLT
jgi:hypothetical protein